jgi:hypothetical protein
MKILKDPSVSSSVGIVLGAAGVIVGLAGVLGVVYGNFFQEHQLLVLVISAIIGLLTFIIMMGALWHFVEPLKNKFTKPLFSKKSLSGLLERSKRFKKYLLLIAALDAMALILLIFLDFTRIIDIVLAFVASIVGGLAAIGYFWDKHQHILSGWVEEFCKKSEILLLTPRKDTAFVKKLTDLLERNNVKCNFVNTEKEPDENRRDLSEKLQSHKAVIVLYETIEAKNWLNAQVVKIRQLSQDRKQPSKNIVVCNTTGTRLDINLSPAQILNCSTENLERDLQSFINQVNK